MNLVTFTTDITELIQHVPFLNYTDKIYQAPSKDIASYNTNSFSTRVSGILLTGYKLQPNSGSRKNNFDLPGLLNFLDTLKNLTPTLYIGNISTMDSNILATSRASKDWHFHARTPNYPGAPTYLLLFRQKVLSKKQIKAALAEFDRRVLIGTKISKPRNWIKNTLQTDNRVEQTDNKTNKTHKKATVAGIYISVLFHLVTVWSTAIAMAAKKDQNTLFFVFKILSGIMIISAFISFFFSLMVDFNVEDFGKGASIFFYLLVGCANLYHLFQINIKKIGRAERTMNLIFLFGWALGFSGIAWFILKDR